MPKMGDAMEEGTLLKWLKSEGEEVSEGETRLQRSRPTKSRWSSKPRTQGRSHS
jgi:hypothetical protein